MRKSIRRQLSCRSRFCRKQTTPTLSTMLGRQTSKDVINTLSQPSCDKCHHKVGGSRDDVGLIWERDCLSVWKDVIIQISISGCSKPIITPQTVSLLYKCMRMSQRLQYIYAMYRHLSNHFTELRSSLVFMKPSCLLVTSNMQGIDLLWLKCG